MTVHTMSCEVCGAGVAELRRGRCWSCYSQWAESRPVGFGASCVLCGERRRDMLKSVELLSAWVPCCHSCHARALRLDPMPQSLSALREKLRRERRDTQRRGARPDTRVFQRDRRFGDRRVGRVGDDELVLLIDDDMIIDAHDVGGDVEPAVDNDNLSRDFTRIHDALIAGDK